MIARLIRLCIHHRSLVLLLCGFVVASGLWAVGQTKVDAIPDLSDVQVILRTPFAGQAPQIVEDQVTYPLTTAMLAVPQAAVVRGYSMFGVSFVYVLFEDGTDLYWARSRVLEQLSTVSNKLPPGARPQIGPDATGVGWVYQYVLQTGPYCKNHPQGIVHDPVEDRWYASLDQPDDIRSRLVHHRIFQKSKTVYVDPQTQRVVGLLTDVAEAERPRLKTVVLQQGLERCPIDNTPLVEPNVDLAQLRGLQDWYLRVDLTTLPGVSELASIGGFVKQYQVVVDPDKLLAYGISIHDVQDKVKRSNGDTGGGTIEIGEREFMVRSLGYLGTPNSGDTPETSPHTRDFTARVLSDLGLIAVGTTMSGTPIRLRDVADIRLGPDMRRGLTDWNGDGDVVGGIVVMRFGENANAAIAHVKKRLKELEVGLPPGVAIDVAYDRSDLIQRSIATLTNTLVEEIAVVSVVCMLFLLHARSALVAVFVLPTGVLLSLLLMHLLGINANIMSLGGIALAIGVMVDSSIVMVENAHKHLEWEAKRVSGGGPPRTRIDVITDAAVELGPSLFFSLLIITVSFLPVFVLGEQSGKLFRPLAWTKTFAMASAALLAVTVIPALMLALVRDDVFATHRSRRFRWVLSAIMVGGGALGFAVMPLGSFADWRWVMVGVWVVLSAIVLRRQRLVGEEQNPISRWLEAAYNPAFRLVMRHRAATLVGCLLLMAVTVYPLSQLGSEFMPPLEEGDLLYMPTTDPGLSVGKAGELLQQTGRLIRQFPEVETVLGKAGQAETATDPAPMSMLETTIRLKRDKSLWRTREIPRWFSGWPSWLSAPLAWVWPQHRPITVDELLYGYDMPGGIRVPGLNDAVQIPGLTNAWTMPIRTRIDMLSTGIRTPVGIKIMGPDLKVLDDTAQQMVLALKTAPETSGYTTSAFAEKNLGGSFVDIQIDRQEIARLGLTVEDVNDTVAMALGGMAVTETVEGLERYPVSIRYPHELRDNLPALKAILVPVEHGRQIPLGQLAKIELADGPPMIKSENARWTSWVYVDIQGMDIGRYVDLAKEVIKRQVPTPMGYTVVWSGQYEYLVKAKERLQIVIPVVLVMIVMLLYGATRSWLRVGIVMLAVPFSLIGAIWFLYALDYNLSLAVGVGLIALAGLDAETGLVMLLYLENSFERFSREGKMRNAQDLWMAVHDGAAKRLRPKTMMVITTFVGLVPLLWAMGAGADTMRRLAAPLIGGLGTSFLLELLIYPVLYYTIKKKMLDEQWQANSVRSR